jgi:hypothetical protein
MKRRVLVTLAIAILVFCLVPPTFARVKSVTITGQADWSSPNYSGAYGPYEWVTGKVTYEIDPADALNQIIVDLDKAVRNPETGRVEFSTDFQLLKPKDISLGSKKLLYIVVNRGGRNNNFNDLMANRGYTIVWSGWQGNIPFGLIGPDTGSFGNDFPIAKNPDGSPITGKVYNTFYVGAGNTASVAYSLVLTYDRGRGYKDIPAYYADHLDDPNAQLWKHEYPYADRVLIDKSQWAFAKANPDGSRGEPSANDVWLNGGFQPGLGYEIVYTGMDPLVHGLSFASVRDLMAFLKYDDSAANPVRVAGGMQAALGYGKSQSGRFLRVLTHLGFNESEDHKQVFDGIYADAPGGSQGAFNFRFCNPGRVTAADVDIYQLTDYPPSSFSVTTDPYTGITGSLLDRAIARNVVPKFFQIQTSAEYWTRSGALAHLLPDASADQEFPAAVRYYHVSSTQHSPNTNSTTNPVRQLPSNPNNYKPVIDGLLVALDEWVSQGVLPPPNTLPTIKDATMGPWDRAGSGFPEIPGVNYPAWIHEPPIFDPSTMVDGVVTELPMHTLAPHFYPALAPKVDVDGNEIAGIRTPDVQCPLGTYTGWTLYQGAFGTGTPIRNAGSFIPFAATTAEREAAGDPRLSLEERYRTHGQYVSCVAQAAHNLAKQRFILWEAVDGYVGRAAESGIGKKAKK